MRLGYLKFIACIILAFLITGCGKATLETGDYATDQSVLGDGCFDIKSIDTSFIPGEFNSEARTITDSGYEYVLSSYNVTDYSTSYYFVSFDHYGKTLGSGELDMPLSSSDNKVVFSDICNDLDIKPYSLTVDNGYIYYSDFSFNDAGDFTGYCTLNSTLEGRDSGTIYKTYKVSWNSEGKCTGIEDVTGSDINYSEYVYIYDQDVNTEYQTVSSGITIVDSSGNYISGYFNAINSGVYIRNFDNLSIRDENCFAGIYRDIDGHTLLACFNRHQGGNYSKKAILLACTGLDEELKADIVRFNQTNKDYMISVQDFTDRVQSGTESEAWNELKEEIAGGYSPDIILNTSGYDKPFIDKLSSEGKLAELSGVIYKDSSLKGLAFSDIAEGLFYEKGSIFSVVPYYEYDTVVGNSEAMELYSGWDLSGYTVYSMSVPDYYYLIDQNYQDRLLERFLFYNGSGYVNYGTHTSEFDSDEMKKLLEYASTLPSMADYYADYRSEAGKGDFKVSEVRCEVLGNTHLDATINCLGQYSDLGFPRATGGSGVITTSRCFMISSGHAYTNECWEFVKQYLSQEYQAADFHGIPVTEAGFTAWKTYTTPNSINPDDYSYFVGDTEYVVNDPTADEVNYIVDHIGSCKMFAFSDYQIEQIVIDYAHQYFEGKLSLDDTVISIDKDVEAYLSNL